MTGEPRAALGPAVREVRGRLAAVAVLSVAGGLCEAAALVLVAQVAARLAADDTVSPVDVGPAHLGAGSVGIQIALGMGLVVVRVVCQLGASWLAASGAAVVRRRLTHEVVAAFGGAAWEVQSVEREGSLLHLAGQEVERTAAATMGLAQLAANACSLAMLVAAALWTDPLAAAATIVSVAVIHLALRPLTQRTRRRVLDRSRREVDVGQSLSEAARMAEEARAFGVESAITGRVDDDVADVVRHGARVWFLGLSVSTLYQGVALTLVFAALAAVSVTDPSGPATLAAVVLVLLRAFAYSQQAQVAYHTVHELLPSAGRITDALARYRERAERWGTTALGPVTSLRLLDVGYHYPTGRRALDGVTVDIPPGATVGVIGPSGAGKSTLVQILLGLREPTSGAYLVNGRLPREYRHDDWARQVSVVPQDPQLIAGTVLDNIRFHRPHLTDEAVRAAARAARIDGEVAEWPLGDATLLGPGGTALSGGQRQRVCLARALADRPALLVLDEPTSALDARSEALVRESLRALPGDVTIVIIAHRLSTLTICSWLLVLDRGRLEASGTPDDLAGLGGFYREALELSGLA